MKAFLRTLWMVSCVVVAGAAGALFGSQYNLAGAAILDILGMAFGIAIGYSSPWRTLEGLFHFLS